MKAINIYKTSLMLLAFASITACSANNNKKHIQENGTLMETKGKSQFALKHLDVDKKKVMAYVTCSEHTVDSLLSIADTAYSKTGSYSLEDLGMDNEEYNKWITKDYKDTISIVIALFDSYASMVNSGMDEASASFVWHEVARQQMKHFYVETGGEWQEPDSYEKLFHVIDGVMRSYDGGGQADINMVAWRSVMLIDYRLIEAYKQLVGLCTDRAMVKLIHDDYMYTLTTYRAHSETIEECYSDLPREQGELFKWLLSSKLENVNLLIKNYKRGKIGSNAVKKNLQEHLCLANKRLVKLTKDFLDRKRDDFR